MNQALLLFSFRLVSAALLLILLGGMAWLVYQDLRLSATTVAEQYRSQGHLRVIESEEGGPVVDALFPLLPVISISKSKPSMIIW